MTGAAKGRLRPAATVGTTSGPRALAEWSGGGRPFLHVGAEGRTKAVEPEQAADGHLVRVCRHGHEGSHRESEREEHEKLRVSERPALPANDREDGCQAHRYCCSCSDHGQHGAAGRQRPEARQPPRLPRPASGLEAWPEACPPLRADRPSPRPPAGARRSSRRRAASGMRRSSRRRAVERCRTNGWPTPLRPARLARTRWPLASGSTDARRSSSARSSRTWRGTRALTRVASTWARRTGLGLGRGGCDPGH